MQNHCVSLAWSLPCNFAPLPEGGLDYAAFERRHAWVGSVRRAGLAPVADDIGARWTMTGVTMTQGALCLFADDQARHHPSPSYACANPDGTIAEGWNSLRVLIPGRSVEDVSQIQPGRYAAVFSLQV